MWHRYLQRKMEHLHAYSVLDIRFRKYGIYQKIVLLRYREHPCFHYLRNNDYVPLKNAAFAL